jgi:hypothetical protein
VPVGQVADRVQVQPRLAPVRQLDGDDEVLVGPGVVSNC